MKGNRLLIGICLLLFANSSYSQDGRVLQVPYVHQIRNTCWAAASTEILQYYGKSVQLCEFVAWTRKSCQNCCANFTSDNLLCTDGGTNTEIVSGLKHWGMVLKDNPNNTKTVLSFSQCKYFINSGIPFMVRWYQKWNGGGHAVVCHGYREDDAKYLYYVNSNDGYHIVSYDWMVESDRFKWDWTISFTNKPNCESSDLIFTKPITINKQIKSSNNVNACSVISGNSVKFEFGNEFTATDGFEVKLGSTVEIVPNKTLKCK